MMRFSRTIALMFIIGFVGFLGSVFTGSYALAGVAGGFFAGATCAMALGIVSKDEADAQPEAEIEGEQEETPAPPVVGRSKYGGGL